MSSPLKRKCIEQIVTRSWTKKQKIDESPIPERETEPEPSNPATKQNISKLSDLNEDCQIEIFRFCSIDDLVNVVQYDKHLSNAARWIFKQKTQEKFVCFSNEIEPEKRYAPTAQLKMLNRFGSEIDGIKLVYDDEYRRFDNIIERAINNRCHKTLKSLRIENAGRYSLFDIKRPFKNVRKLQFSVGMLNHIIPKMGQWFPNARTLRISYSLFPTKNMKKMAPKHCHALRELQIRSHPIIQTGYAKWITDFIDVNPQLTKLSITYHTIMMTMLCMRMPDLSNLHLEIIPSRFHVNSSVHFEKLKKLSFRGQASKINVTADEIDTLDINLQWLMSDDLNNLVHSGTSLNCLNIIEKWHVDSYPDNVIERIKDIADLKELTFPANDAIKTKEIVNLIGGCKTLKWIFIHAEKEMPEYPGIKESLGAGWIVHRRNAMVNNKPKLGFVFQKIETKT